MVHAGRSFLSSLRLAWRKVCFRSVLLCSCVLAPVLTQNIAAQIAPTRDPVALEHLQTALTAMGGLSAVGQVKDFTITGQSQPGNGAAPGSFNIKGQGSEFRVETQGGNHARVYVSGHGSAQETRDGRNSQLPYHYLRANRPLSIPALILLQALNDPRYAISLAGAEEVDGRNSIHVHIADESDEIGKVLTAQEWYFDSQSAMPVLVKYCVPDPRDAANYHLWSLSYSDFRSVNGVHVPFTLQSSLAQSSPGSYHVKSSVSSVVFNSGIRSSEFDTADGSSR